jgi:hypothetical protein
VGAEQAIEGQHCCDEVTETIEIDVYCGDEFVASVRGNRVDAAREALHYASMYSPDGAISFALVERMPLTVDDVEVWAR